MSHRKSSSGLSRRLFLGTAMSLPLAGCGDKAFFDSLVSTSRYLTVGLEGPELTRKFISDLPYATMRARIGRGPQVLIVLAEKRNANLVWVTGDNIVIVTRAGRVVTVIGIDRSITETAYLSPDPLAGAPHKITEPVTFARTILTDTKERDSYTVDSVIEPVGEEKITILDLNFDTIKLRERNETRYANWAFENFYWVDRNTGFIWRSQQYISRDFRPMALDTLKPAAV